MDKELREAERSGELGILTTQYLRARKGVLAWSRKKFDERAISLELAGITGWALAVQGMADAFDLPDGLEYLDLSSTEWLNWPRVEIFEETNDTGTFFGELKPGRGAFSVLGISIYSDAEPAGRAEWWWQTSRGFAHPLNLMMQKQKKVEAEHSLGIQPPPILKLPKVEVFPMEAFTVRLVGAILGVPVRVMLHGRYSE